MDSKKMLGCSPQLCVKYGQTQPLGYIFFNDIFNQTFGFKPLGLPKIGLKQPSIF